MKETSGKKRTHSDKRSRRAGEEAEAREENSFRGKCWVKRVEL